MPKEAEKAIAQFRRLLTRHYPDAQAYLFGSYANGTWLEDSDLDIIVISKEFSDQTFAARVESVRRLAPREKPFEIIAYTPSEFREAQRRSILIQDARRYWRRII